MLHVTEICCRENRKLRRKVQELQEAEGRTESRCRGALEKLKVRRVGQLWSLLPRQAASNAAE